MDDEGSEVPKQDDFQDDSNAKEKMQSVIEYNDVSRKIRLTSNKNFRSKRNRLLMKLKLFDVVQKKCVSS